MKGDFTRSTFRPQKHYTSVRMQQGRLQLDADWNEQADIQNYLRRAQTVDMIGAGSGAASVELATGKRNENGFRVLPVVLYAKPQVEDGTPAEEDTASSATAITDLALIPGHFYASGVLCELEEGSNFDAEFIAIDPIQVAVSSLTVDGRALAVGQWLTQVTAFGIEGGDRLNGWQIRSIDTRNRVLTLDGDLVEDAADSDSPSDDTSAAVPAFEPGKIRQLRRLLTYFTQPNYPNPPALKTSARQILYVDAWQRHVTAIDDRQIRDNALNVPDTTTRTQTVWQLKALPAPDEETQSVDDYWQDFLAARRQPTAFLNACAGLCRDGRNNGNLLPLRLENQLYRVEIHTPGGVTNSNGEGATFKWSRDNGSLASEVESVDKVRSIIRIRQSNQEAWGTTQPGQWLELTTEERELKIEPGVLVPFVSAVGNQITFDGSNIVGGSDLPEKITKIRRWDQLTDEGTMPLQETWIALEAGLKIKFGPDKIQSDPPAQSLAINSEIEQTLGQAPALGQKYPEYKTGDYWLIPARSGPQDIEWPNDGASEDPSPIAQPPAGIDHMYGLLAVTNAAPNEPVADKRVVFPPLLQALDRRGGVITGDLTVQGTFTTEDFNVTGNFKADTFRGTTFEVALDPTSDSPEKYGSIQIDEATKQINFVADAAESFNFASGSVNVAETLTVAKRATFARENGQTVGIGRDSTGAKLDVMGDVKVTDTLEVTKGVIIGPAIARSAFILDVNGDLRTVGSGLWATTADSRVDIGAVAPSVAASSKLFVAGDTYIDGALESDTLTLRNGEITSISAANLTLKTGSATRMTVDRTNGHVGIGPSAPSDTFMLNVEGDIQGAANSLFATNPDSRVEVGAIAPDTLTPKPKLYIKGNTVIEGTLSSNNLIFPNGSLQSPTNTNLTLKTGSATQMTIAHTTGHIGIGQAPDSNVKVGISGNLVVSEVVASNSVSTLVASNGFVGIGKRDPDKALDVIGDASVSNALSADTLTTNTLTASTLNSDTLEISQKAILATANDSMVCIGTEAPPAAAPESADPADPKVKLYVEGNITARAIGAQNFAQLSTRTVKTDISALSSQDALVLLGQLNPVKFIYKEDAEQNLSAGFIAEDTPDILTSANHKAIKILDVAAVVTRAVKDQQVTISRLIELANKQQSDIENLSQRLAQLEHKNVPP
ncbi:MAG: DUF6519 domain-containing protein [Phormidesmis sp.]